MSIMWATRGRTWGFRFIRDGGITDPIRVYEDVFSAVGDEPEVCHRVDDKVALRFPDPLERKDRSGRTIPHDFVVFAPLSGEINTVDDGIRRIWPQVADEFAMVWDLAKAPSAIE